MASKQRTSWKFVSRGDIIEFAYNDNQRTVLVLHRGLKSIKKDGGESFLLHGIELEKRGRKQVRTAFIRSIVDLSEGLSFRGRKSGEVQLGIDIKKKSSREAAAQIFYREVKKLLSNNPIPVYKTYDKQILGRGSVFLADFQFPTDLTEELYGHYYAGYEQSKRDLPTFGKKRTARDKV